MPKYIVKDRGFINGRIEEPGAVVTVDKAFKVCPKWLEPMKEGKAPKFMPAENEEPGAPAEPSNPGVETL